MLAEAGKEERRKASSKGSENQAGYRCSRGGKIKGWYSIIVGLFWLIYVCYPVLKNYMLGKAKNISKINGCGVIKCVVITTAYLTEYVVEVVSARFD